MCWLSFAFTMRLSKSYNKVVNIFLFSFIPYFHFNHFLFIFLHFFFFKCHWIASDSKYLSSHSNWTLNEMEQKQVTKSRENFWHFFFLLHSRRKYFGILFVFARFVANSNAYFVFNGKWLSCMKILFYLSWHRDNHVWEISFA